MTGTHAVRRSACRVAAIFSENASLVQLEGPLTHTQDMRVQIPREAPL